IEYESDYVTIRGGIEDGSMHVVGATAWGWARKDFGQSVDVLIVDEAGQNVPVECARGRRRRQEHRAARRSPAARAAVTEQPPGRQRSFGAAPSAGRC